MKKLIYLSIVVLLFSCKPNDPKEALKDSCEKLLLSQLNDPKSYEFVSFEVDTLNKSVLNQRVVDLKALQKKYTEQKDEVMIEIINNQIEAAEALLPEKNKGDIEFKYTYRAKNAMNALILDSKKVVSDSKYNFKEMN